MGKRKKSRESTKSSGERPNTNRSVLKSVRKEYLSESFSRLNNQVSAWRAGKKVMVTIPNPNEKETNKPFIRVNALDVWGPPREMSDMYSRKRKNDRVN